MPAALTRYAAYAGETRDRLGAEPGEQLQRLHVELLARDAPVREGLKYDAAPMIGRDSDVAAIRALLDHSRVVSILGPGGLGKTRMAHLVGRLAEQPVVQLVELAGVNSPEGVLPEIATVLGVRDSVATSRHTRPSADLRGRVAQHLVGASTLLIIDNCEHLVETVADVVAFLTASVPDLRVLTTSRAALGIAAEQVYQLPQLGERDAVELFHRRALAARPGVRLDDAEVGRLVARLDGLPLAIELAAAKVRVMSVADVSRRLEDRFALLRGGDRSAPDRHQTLEAVIDWSWQLLGESPRDALRSLSVFPDGFSLSGADAVLGRDAMADITHLAEQSLLVVREDDEVRYRFLETVREYGAARLDESGERARVEQALFAWAVATSRALGAAADGRRPGAHHPGGSRGGGQPERGAAPSDRAGRRAHGGAAGGHPDQLLDGAGRPRERLRAGRRGARAAGRLRAHARAGRRAARGAGRPHGGFRDPHRQGTGSGAGSAAGARPGRARQPQQRDQPGAAHDVRRRRRSSWARWRSSPRTRTRWSSARH